MTEESDVAFSNPVVAGEELIRTAIRSANYVAGVSGWRIDREGSADFNDVTLRGGLVNTGADVETRIQGDGIVIEDVSDPTLQANFGTSEIVYTSVAGNEVRLTANGNDFIGFRGDSSKRGAYYNRATGFLATGSYDPIVLEGWVNFTFAAGWGAPGQPCSYKLFPDGLVRLRGIANHTAAGVPGAGTLVTTLPVGYRPVQYTLIPNAYDASATKGRVEVNTDGTVRVFDAPNDFPCFDSVTFSVV